VVPTIKNNVFLFMNKEVSAQVGKYQEILDEIYEQV
jgi:hypothetical protein